ncbi:unnamed protein product, partial [marine sediment metagenome]
QRKKNMRDKIKAILINKTARQTTLLLLAQIFSMFIALMTGLIIPKKLGVEIYGIYSFAIAVLSFMAVFFEFGYFTTGARMLALTNDKEKEKELLAALLIILITISLLFIFTILILSYFIVYLFEDNISEILRYTSIVSFYYIVPVFLNSIKPRLIVRN